MGSQFINFLRKNKRIMTFGLACLFALTVGCRKKTNENDDGDGTQCPVIVSGIGLTGEVDENGCPINEIQSGQQPNGDDEPGTANGTPIVNGDDHGTTNAEEADSEEGGDEEEGGDLEGEEAAQILSLLHSTFSANTTKVNYGESALITVTLKDEDDQLIADTTDFDIQVAQTTGTGMSEGSWGPITHNGDGTVSATFTGTVVGTPTTISATIDGEQLSDSAPTIEVLFNNSYVADMSLWLKSDSGVVVSGTDVTSWADQSGLGNDAESGPANACNGAPQLSSQMIGGSIHPTISFTRGSGVTAQCLVVPDDPADSLQPADGITIFMVGSSTTTQNYQVFLIKTDDGTWTDGWGLHRGNNGSKIAFFVDGYTKAASSASFNANQFYIVNAKYDLDSNDITVGTDGTTLSTGSHTSLSGPDSRLWIGDDVLKNGGGLDGDIAEIIIYDRDLSPTEATKVEEYLSRKYNIPLP
jgi:hypothetical protein